MKKHFRVISVLVAIVLVFSSFITVFAVSENSDGEIKNVIIMIGDGMGENHLEMAKQLTGISDLAMESMPYRGQSMTRSFSNSVTDSAAGGSAIACGTRIINNCVAVYPFDICGGFVVPKSITEAAIENGMLTGIVTSDKTSGATPASFSAHTSSRTNSGSISKQQANSDIDLIWGAKESAVNTELVKKNGFNLITTTDEMLSLRPGTRSFGQFDGDLWAYFDEESEIPSLSLMTNKAISLLDNEKGFFLMIEGAHIDKHSHNNEGEKMAEALIEFDASVACALDFAANDGHTLVIVTADHETGGITKNENGAYIYTRGSHSGANVPLLAYGSDNFIKNGEVIKNKDIPIRAANLMGISNEFNKNGMGSFLKFFNSLFKSKYY